MLSGNNIDPLRIRLRRFHGKGVVSPFPNHSGGFNQLPDFSQRVSLLIMHFLTAVITAVSALNKKIQDIFIDLRFLIIIIIPDKAVVFPRLSDSLLAQYILIFIEGI